MWLCASREVLFTGMLVTVEQAVIPDQPVKQGCLHRIPANAGPVGGGQIVDQLRGLRDERGLRYLCTALDLKVVRAAFEIAA
jgi:hypothetical protein